ncbi:MAG: response regulator [Planctomycetales bacterium]|nr:response regulator [Planctomycetales bacterium]
MTDKRIGVIDDHSHCREAIATLLRSAGFVAEGFANANELMGARALSEWHCVLVDLRLHNDSGRRVADQLQQLRSDLPVIILTAHISTHDVLSSFAHRMLSKSCTADELITAIEHCTRS